MQSPPFADLAAQLAERLRHSLPGPAAQSILAPPPRQMPDGGGVRHAAGLLLVFPILERAHLLLTRRADTLGRHGGQISLPGGVVETGETIEQAALREAHEEIGLASSEARILGALTPIDIRISGFRLHPVVAAIDRRQEWRAADGEVSGILEIPVDDLLDHSCLVTVSREREGLTLAVPAFRAGGEEIWGATGMVLAEFLALLGWPDGNSHGLQ